MGTPTARKTLPLRGLFATAAGEGFFVSSAIFWRWLRGRGFGTLFDSAEFADLAPAVSPGSIAIPPGDGLR